MVQQERERERERAGEIKEIGFVLNWSRIAPMIEPIQPWNAVSILHKERGRAVTLFNDFLATQKSKK